MQSSITITDAAAAYIKKKMIQEQGIGFRLSIKKTGCSGYSYIPSVIQTVQADDICLAGATGIDLFIDPAWLHLLTGLKIDYIEEEKLGLKQKRLVFINPNEANRCGCGESFNLKE